MCGTLEAGVLTSCFGDYFKAYCSPTSDWSTRQHPSATAYRTWNGEHGRDLIWNFHPLICFSSAAPFTVLLLEVIDPNWGHLCQILKVTGCETHSPSFLSLVSTHLDSAFHFLECMIIDVDSKLAKDAGSKNRKIVTTQMSSQPRFADCINLSAFYPSSDEDSLQIKHLIPRN